MLSLILIHVQYLQNVVFSFGEGSNGQNYSSSDTHLLIKFFIYKISLTLKSVWKTLLDILSKVSLCTFFSILNCNLTNQKNPSIKAENYRPRGAFSALRHYCNQVWRILVQTPVGAGLCLGNKIHYVVPGILRVKNVKLQLLTSGKISTW